MHEIQKLLHSVKTICPDLTDIALAEFGASLTLKHLNKKDFFILSGQVQAEVGFITKGLIRCFFIDDKGIEKTVNFFSEKDYVTHYSAFLSRRPSKYSFQCLEETTLVSLSLESMEWAYRKFPEFERYGRLMAEEILKMQQNRIESFLFQTAEARYLDFVDQYPQLFNRISLSHLCSYLGIERQSLTRIRQKLARK